MKETKLQKLIFVYNADSGLRNLIIDGAHKILSPRTYDCKLCEITFDAFSENKVWKRFRTEVDLEMEFLHKDEFKKRYASKFGHKFTYPIVLSESLYELDVWINTEELNGLKNASALIQLIQERST